MKSNKKRHRLAIFCLCHSVLLTSCTVLASSSVDKTTQGENAQQTHSVELSGLAYKTVSQLSEDMANGELTSVELVQFLLQRIETLDKQGPAINAVVELNPEALAIAAQRDNERLEGELRGPLHGIPVLLKDNISTADTLQTTAGSLALLGEPVGYDADVVRKLREGGAIILGKANLSEWMGFRGTNVPNGWSGRGGKTLNPHVLQADPCGSSTGSAVAVAAGLVPLSVGTETNGSINCPAFANGVVGVKPTRAVIDTSGIVVFSVKQDTLGAFARTVSDAAALLGLMLDNPVDLTAALDPFALQGKRIGYPDRFIPGSSEWDKNPDFVKALTVLKDAGATLVPVAPVQQQFDHYFEFMAMEFNLAVNAYLASREDSAAKDLTQLIAFNDQSSEGRDYNQAFIELAHATPYDRVRYDELWKALYTFHQQEIDNTLTRNAVDAVIDVPISIVSSVIPLIGYPSVTLPNGLDHNGLPTGLYFYGAQGSDSQLLSMAYAYEQLRPMRQNPAFRSAPQRNDFKQLPAPWVFND